MMLAVATSLAVTIGTISILTGTESISETANSLLAMTLNRAYDRTMLMLNSTNSLLYATANSTLMYTFLNTDMNATLNRNVLDVANNDVITLHWQVALQNSFLSASGYYLEANSNYMATYSPASFIAVSDETTRAAYASNNSYITRTRCNPKTPANYTVTTPAGTGLVMSGTCVMNATTVKGHGPDGSLIFNPGNPVRGDWDLKTLWSVVYNSTGKPVWAPITYSPNPVLRTFLVPLIQPLWYRQPVGTSDGGTFYAAQFVTMTLSSLEHYLPTIKPTNNTVIAFIDTKGAMIASSEPYATADLNQPANVVVTRYKAHASSNPIIAATAKYLFPSYATSDDAYVASVQTAPEITDSFTGPDGTQYLLQTRWISDPYGLRWLMLLTTPRADFFAPIDKMKYTVIGVCVGLGLLGVLFAIFASIVVIMPIKRLNSAMREATNFDFSALRSGYLDHRSAFLEIAEMQHAFALMLSRFADAISSNRALAGGRGAGSGSAGNGANSNSNHYSSSNNNNNTKSSGYTSYDRQPQPQRTPPVSNTNMVYKEQQVPKAVLMSRPKYIEIRAPEDVHHSTAPNGGYVGGAGSPPRRGWEWEEGGERRYE
ncbi:hypothetical protein HDV00_005943 [Rhizophlyctis rosea]|nr:hypothetical protein HDV00_005943 [Rhizophlyctis rosea]